MLEIKVLSQDVPPYLERLRHGRSSGLLLGGITVQRDADKRRYALASKFVTRTLPKASLFSCTIRLFKGRQAIC